MRCVRKSLSPAPIKQGSINGLVFLGGSCNPTSWRKDVVIPMLVKSEIDFFNPQVDNWSEELIELEATAKKNAACFLFVIDGQTRALASMIEAVELLMKDPSSFVLVVQNISNNTKIEDQTITGRELKDLNRARAYLQDCAFRNGVAVHSTVLEGAREVVRKMRSSEPAQPQDYP
jgi:hypothetical protein